MAHRDGLVSCLCPCYNAMLNRGNSLLICPQSYPTKLWVIDSQLFRLITQCVYPLTGIILILPGFSRRKIDLAPLSGCKSMIYTDSHWLEEDNLHMTSKLQLFPIRFSAGRPNIVPDGTQIPKHLWRQIALSLGDCCWMPCPSSIQHTSIRDPSVIQPRLSV